MGRKLVSLLVLTALMLNLAFIPSPVKAEGSVAQSRGHFYFNYQYQYAMNGTDETPDTAVYTLEDWMRGSVIEFPVSTDWIIDIPNTQAYIWCDNWGNPNKGQMAIYEIDAAGNAGQLLGQSTENLYLEADDSGSKYSFYYNGEPGGNVTVTGEWGIYIMVWAETSVGGTYTYAEDLGDAGTVPYGGLHHSQVYSYGNAEDPMAGETLTDDRYFGVWAYIKGRQDLASSTNTRYGDPDDYIALRTWEVNWGDVDDTKPTTAYFTYPVTEELVNITIEGTTLISANYTVDNFNITHDRVNIPDTTFNNVWNDSLCQVSLYTESYDYKYTFSAPTYENGTVYPDPVIVTAHIPSGNEELNVTSIGYDFGTDEEPEMFSWDIGGGYTRRVYSIGSENITVTVPETDFATYSFTIRDYTGQVGSGNSYLEALRIVNGNQELIERMIIWDTANMVPLSLVKNQIYSLRIRFKDDSTYSFGYFIPGVDWDPSFSIYDISFSAKAHMIGEAITVEATRPTDEHIQINYLDDMAVTEEVFVEICHLNGTQVWNETSTLSTFQMNWYDAVNITDYLVYVDIEHEVYGHADYGVALSGAWDPSDPIDLDWLYPGLTEILAIGFIISSLLVFSTQSAQLGTGVAVIMAAFWDYLGWIEIPSFALGFAFVAVVIWYYVGRMR